MKAHKNQLPGYPLSGLNAMSGEEERKRKVSVKNGQVKARTNVLDALPALLRSLED